MLALIAQMLRQAFGGREDRRDDEFGDGHVVRPGVVREYHVVLEQLGDEQRVDPRGDGVEPAQARRRPEYLAEALWIRAADARLDAVERRDGLVLSDHDEVDVGKSAHEVLRVATEAGRDRHLHWDVTAPSSAGYSAPCRIPLGNVIAAIFSAMGALESIAVGVVADKLEPVFAIPTSSNPYARRASNESPDMTLTLPTCSSPGRC